VIVLEAVRNISSQPIDDPKDKQQIHELVPEGTRRKIFAKKPRIPPPTIGRGPPILQNSGKVENGAHLLRHNVVLVLRDSERGNLPKGRKRGLGKRTTCPPLLLGLDKLLGDSRLLNLSEGAGDGTYVIDYRLQEGVEPRPRNRR